MCPEHSNGGLCVVCCCSKGLDALIVVSHTLMELLQESENCLRI